MIMIQFLKTNFFLYLDRFTMFRERKVPDYLNQNKPSLIILPKGNIHYVLFVETFLDFNSFPFQK